MGGLVDAIFGRSAKDAANAQTRATRDAMQTYKEGVDEAKREIMPRFDEAAQQRLQRTQQAMDVMNAGFTPQLDTLTQGNMSAQQMLAGSMPQMQNAILGRPVDYSFMQPQGINFDASSFLSGMPTVFDANETPSPDIGVPTFNGSNGYGGSVINPTGTNWGGSNERVFPTIGSGFRYNLR